MLLLEYDEFHTPINEIFKATEGHFDRFILLSVALGGLEDKEPSAPAPWHIRRVDARERFCAEAIIPAIKANAVYQGGYPLSAALSRPLLAAICAETLGGDAKEATVMHGFAGNDQLRFEMAILTLLPAARIISVASCIGSRNSRNDGAFTISSNLWGRSVESGALADPGIKAPPAAFSMVAHGSSRVPSETTITFEQGIPVALDGEPLSLAEIISKLNKTVGGAGAGYCDMVEDGYVGLKTRALYEYPGAAALLAAHGDLERFVCTARQNRFKALADMAWTELVYEGGWFDPQRESLEALIGHINRRVCGEVKILPLPGGVRVVERRSPYGLYSAAQAVYRIGQDVGVGDRVALARELSTHMRAAHAAQPAPHAAGKSAP